MKTYIQAQKKKIEIDKWCEGCKRLEDPGKEYILTWIDQNGAWFRAAWEESLCKSCRLSQECGYNVLKSCANYRK